MKFPTTPTCSTLLKINGILYGLLDYQKKIRIFGWRAANNLLPTAENLWKRKVVQELTYQLCRNSLENIFHALVTCKAAKNVWKTTPFVAEIGEVARQDMLRLLHNIYKLRSKADVELLVAIFWVIWSARNKFIFKGKRENPQVLVAKVEAVIEAYEKTQVSMRAFAGDQQSITQRTWSPPKSGYCKVNVDATTNLEKKILGL